MSEAKEAVRRVCAEFDNVHFVEDGVVDAGAFAVVGATLWGRLPDDPQRRENVAGRMSDVRHIYADRATRAPITVSDYADLAAAGERSLRSSFDEALQIGKPIVVVTHHAPSHEAVSPEAVEELRGRFGDLPRDELLAPYAGHVPDLIRSPVRMWVHGHCHCSSALQVSGVDVVCNAVGYKDHRNEHFRIKDIVLDVPVAPPEAKTDVGAPS
eukprot:TRINITY_DN35979_c0_g1_i1.p1 TRINITY_DN35979_c0_g1~~TRINITY_DN35979_c0_g1_i1.p1  ORF type:complete len:212 (+),score=25.74 TRINITY_DN35979_c0_g1_i1:453-1088(+)